MTEGGISLRVLFGGTNASGKYPNKLFGLSEDCLHFWFGNKPGVLQKPKPASRLFQLFQANTQLVNEIFARFCCLHLSMISERRRSAAQQLTGNVVRCSRIRQRIDESDYARTEFK